MLIVKRVGYFLVVKYLDGGPGSQKTNFLTVTPFLQERLFSQFSVKVGNKALQYNRIPGTMKIRAQLKILKCIMMKTDRADGAFVNKLIQQ